MLRSRVGFHTALERFAWDNGLQQVYFDPPGNVLMKYPCIVYEEVGMDIKPADNKPYIRHNEYELKIITNDADSKLPYLLENAFPYAVRYSGRRYISDNLHHYVLNCRVSTKL